MHSVLQIWQSVKEQNPTLSVCEIGAQIGKMWRELTDEQKQKYNEDFTKEKVGTCVVFDANSTVVKIVHEITLVSFSFSCQDSAILLTHDTNAVPLLLQVHMA